MDMVGQKKFNQAGPFEIRGECQGAVSNEDHDKEEEKLKKYYALKKFVLDRAKNMEAAKKMESFHKIYKFPKKVINDSISGTTVPKMTNDSVWKWISPERASGELLTTDDSDQTSSDFDDKWERAVNYKKDFSTSSYDSKLKYVPLTCENVSRFDEEQGQKTNDLERSTSFESNGPCNKGSPECGIVFPQHNSHSQSDIEVTKPESNTSRDFVDSPTGDCDKNVDLLYKEIMLMKNKMKVKQNIDELSSSLQSHVDRFDEYSKSYRFDSSVKL
ncbi:hypothetical protein TKK_0003577 [Trichogramma kaykai]